MSLFTTIIYSVIMFGSGFVAGYLLRFEQEEQCNDDEKKSEPLVINANNQPDQFVVEGSGIQVDGTKVPDLVFVRDKNFKGIVYKANLSQST